MVMTCRFFSAKIIAIVLCHKKTTVVLNLPLATGAGQAGMRQTFTGEDVILLFKFVGGTTTTEFDRELQAHKAHIHQEERREGA